MGLLFNRNDDNDEQCANHHFDTDESLRHQVKQIVGRRHVGVHRGGVSDAVVVTVETVTTCLHDGCTEEKVVNRKDEFVPIDLLQRNPPTLRMNEKESSEYAERLREYADLFDPEVDV